MKHLLRLILPVAALATVSCTKYDYKQELEKYTDNVFFVADRIAGQTHVSTHGEIRVEGDLASQSYIVKIDNVQLSDGAPLRSASVSNLLQFYKEKGESEEDKLIPLYFYFPQSSTTRTSGDLDVSNMRYCYITNSFWISFASDSRYDIWGTPRVRSLYANYNRTQSPVSAGYIVENSLCPSYKFTLNVEQKTVTIVGNGVKLRQDAQDPSKSLDFKTMELRDIPIEFSSTGYAFFVNELIPIINGDPAPQHTITNFQAEIAFDYDGKKTFTYKILNGEGQNISVETKFGLTRLPNTTD